MSERWDDAETQAWQQARAARLREAVARLEGRDETAPNRPAMAPVSDSEVVEAQPPVRPSERLAAAHRRSVIPHDPPDAPNAADFPPHPARPRHGGLMRAVIDRMNFPYLLAWVCLFGAAWYHLVDPDRIYNATFIVMALQFATLARIVRIEAALTTRQED